MSQTAKLSETGQAAGLMSRRRLLGAIAAGAGVLLSACGAGAAVVSPSATTAGLAKASVSSRLAPSGAAAAGAAARSAAGVASTASSGGALTVSYAAATALILPLWLADATHAFADHKLSVSIKPINQASAMLAAMVAKEVDVALTSGPDVINADLNSDVGMVFVGSVMERATFALLGVPSIRSAADLKGKKVASGHAGTAGDYMLRSALALLKVKPNEVTILELGNNQTVYQAMLSGQVDAGILSPPESLEAPAKGFHVVQDTYSVPYQSNGAVALQPRLSALASVLPGFLAGLKQGIEVFDSQPDLAMKTLGQNTKVDDAAVLKETYDFYHSSAPFNPTLQPSLPSIQSMLDFIGQTEPKARTAKPEQFVDTRFLTAG